MGKEEIKSAKQYAGKEKIYVARLLECRKKMNNIEKNFYLLQKETNGKNITQFVNKVTLLRKAINLLTKQETTRKSRILIPNSELKSHTTSLYSAAITLPYDIKSNQHDVSTLIAEDIAEIASRLRIIRSELHERLKVELDHVEIWQNQSLYFFAKLEVNIIYFFALTTIFTVAAFMLSGYVLRRYLGLLSTGAHEISSGQLTYRFNDTTDDLIGDVMRDFDIMAFKLGEQSKKLQKINIELNNKAAELQSINKHKDQFLANMSHELRTPLNSIIGFSDLIVANSKNLTATKAKNFANKILTAAEHLLELISDLLEIAKVDAGVFTLEPTKFNLNNLSKTVVDMLQPLADQKKIKLTLTLKEKEITISADRRLIRQALINLLNNGLKFTKKGSVELIVYTKKENIVVDIKDSGIGIGENDLKLIFKDFHRAEKGLTSNYEGVGLGLALTKRIVELHKGRITVESKLKKGSTFTITLPIMNENDF